MSQPQDLYSWATGVAIPNGDVFLWKKTAAFAIWNAKKNFLFVVRIKIFKTDCYLILYFLLHCLLNTFAKNENKNKNSTLGFPAMMIAQESSNWDLA